MADIRAAVMAAVTLVLVFLSGRAVFSLFASPGDKDMASMSGIWSDSRDMEGFSGGIGVVPVFEEKPFAGAGLVVIDPGHGGTDNGSSINGVYEQEINLEIALLLAERLEEAGIDTLLLRKDNDTSLSLDERVETAERAGADIYVSIHQNFYEGKDASVAGMETWFSGKLEDSGRLARLVQEKTAEKTGANNRGVIESEELYVLREISIPACLIETGFLSSKGEREALQTEEYQKKIAEGIAEGIEGYFGGKAEGPPQ